MPIATLDPNAALIVIDLQQGLAGFPTLTPLADVAERAAALARAFRARDLPVVLVSADAVPPGRAEQGRRVTQFPPGFADVLPELGQQPSDIVVKKQTPGAFTRTPLLAELQARGVTQVLMTGVSTSMGVEATARQAYEFGFNVAFAVDAMTDLDAGTHQNSIDKIFPRIGERASTAEILALLDGDV